MTTMMTGVTGYATLTQLVQNSLATHAKLDRIANQASTGLVADNYAGMGTGGAVSLNLRPQLANLQIWQNNVDAATGRMSVTQSALNQIQSIAASFYAQLNTAEGINAGAIDSIAASARDSLGQVASMLDTQDGGVYAFAGQDTANPPVPDPRNILNSGFYTAIQTAIGGLAINGAAATASATWSIAAPPPVGVGPSPFSTQMSQDLATVQSMLPVVQIGQNQTATIGIPASANGLIPDLSTSGSTIASGPPSSTGAYMRDVLRALATIGSLSSTQASAPGFQELVQDTRISLSGAISAIAQDAGVLGNIQSSLAATRTGLEDTTAALTGQISAVEDVDMAATLSRLSLVQTQMQASYQLIATLTGLSLTKFLSA